MQEEKLSDDLSDVMLYPPNHFADLILVYYVHRLCEVVISHGDTKSHVGNISLIQQVRWKGKHHETPMQEPAVSCHKVKVS